MTSDYGIKVSRDGVDVKTAGVLDQVFNSSYNCLKIESKIDTSSTASGSRDVDVSHSFGYRPAYLCFFEVDNNNRWYMQGQIEDYSGKNGRIIEVRSYTDKLTISFSSSSSAAIRVIIYLFVDPGE